MEEVWKKIIHDTRYEVSNFGRFRKLNKKGYRYLTPFNKKGTLLYLIKIKDKEYNCARLVANYHIRPLLPNERVYHKNKMNTDNFVRNLKIVSLKQLGKMTGHLSKSKAVVEIEKGKVKRRWDSARKSAKDLYVSYQTVMDYCNGKVKKPMYKLMWEKDYYKD